MWTTETRVRHDCADLRDAHDLIDEEWSVVEPLIPPAKRRAASGLWKSPMFRTA